MAGLDHAKLANSLMWKASHSSLGSAMFRAEVGGERFCIPEFGCGCTCLVSVCEIEPVVSGFLSERDVSALQAARAMVTKPSATARAEGREHKISRTRDIVPYSTPEHGR
jgi:hypothetical protein